MFRILLLEDDEGRINSFKHRFESLFGSTPYEVFIFKDIEPAKEFIRGLNPDQEDFDEDFDLVFLDHDLGGRTYVDPNEPNTGTEFAKFLSTHPRMLPTTPGAIVIHSMNPAGAKCMMGTLPQAVYLPGIWVKDRFDMIFKLHVNPTLEVRKI